MLGYAFDFTAASAESVGAGEVFDLHCNPPQQLANLPDDGAPLTSFQTYVDLSLTTVAAAIRFALYSVDLTMQYTLVASTDAGSDIQVGPGTATGPTVVSTSAPLAYPTGSSYTVLPSVTYSLCFIDNGGAQYIPGTTTNGTVAIYSWQEGSSGPGNVEFAPYDVSQPLPNPLVPTGTSPNTYAVWMTVTAPVVVWKFAYGFQGSLDGTSATAFSVCAVGSFLASPVMDPIQGGYDVWQIYGTRTYTNGSGSVTSNIVGVASAGSDASDNLLFPSAYPYVDAGGITYVLDANAILPGGSYTYTDQYYYGPNPFVDIFAVGGAGTPLSENNYELSGDYTLNQTGVGIVLSPPNSDLVYSCAVLSGAAPLAPGAPGGGSSSSSAALSASSSSSASAASAPSSSGGTNTAASSSSSGAMSSAASASSASSTVASSSASSSSASAVTVSSASSSSSTVAAPSTAAASSSTGGASIAPSSTATAASSSPVVPAPTSSLNPTSTMSPSSVVAPSSVSGVVTPAASSTAGDTTGGGSTIKTSAASNVRGGLAAVAAVVSMAALLA